MKKWATMLLPAIFTGTAVIIWEGVHRVKKIEEIVIENRKYVLVIEHQDKVLDDYESRLRALENLTCKLTKEIP